MTAIEGVAASDGLVDVSWSDGHASQFHALWLRDNCPCEECVHPSTHERTLDTFGIDPSIAPTSIVADATAVSVEWPDGHLTRFDPAWLRDHCYSHEACRHRPSRHTLWGADAAIPEFDYGEVATGDAGLLGWLEALWDYGVTMIRQVPDDRSVGADLARRVEFLRNTNFGLTWDVVARPDAVNNAYTGVALPAHTDLPNRELPPGVQFIHCLSSTASGGDNVMVDGFHAAEVLRTWDEEAWRLLQEVELPYRFHDDDHDLRSRAPVIRRGPDGEYREIRHHIALAAPLDLAPERVEPTYAALRAFANVVRDPAVEVRLRLEPGDLWVFHNRRVLHGRDAYDEGVGDRHLAGCYIDIDELRSRIRVLRRELRP